MTTTTTIQELPAWMRDPLTRMIATGEQLSEEQYTPYQGPRIADFTADQQQAFAGVGDLADYGQVNQGLASQMAIDAGDKWVDANQSAYINPFIEQAIDPAAREIGRANQDILNQYGAQAASSGAFGGSRNALLQSEQNRNFMEEIGDLYAQGFGAAYDRGQAAFFQDQAQGLAAAQALGDIGEQGQLMGLRGQDALIRTGTMQQAHQQDRLGLAYEDFLEQRNWPYSQLSFFNSLVRGIPNVGTITTQTAPEAQRPNVTGQYLGAGIAGLSLIDQLFDI